MTFSYLNFSFKAHIDGDFYVGSTTKLGNRFQEILSQTGEKFAIKTESK